MTISESWDNALKDEYAKPYFTNLMQRVNEEYATHTVYPAKDNLFAAFKYINYDDVKVVILGQDPYHGEGQANGMAFAVNEGVPLPPVACQYLQRNQIGYRRYRRFVRDFDRLGKARSSAS